MTQQRKLPEKIALTQWLHENHKDMILELVDKFNHEYFVEHNDWGVEEKSAKIIIDFISSTLSKAREEVLKEILGELKKKIGIVMDDMSLEGSIGYDKAIVDVFRLITNKINKK